MLNVTTNENLTLPVVTLEGEELSGVTSFEVKYTTKGKAKGVRFKVTIPTPEIVEGTPKFVSKTYVITTPREDEEEEITQERAEVLNKIQDLSEFWAKNQTPSTATKETVSAAV
jgi:hypothetical protein